MKRNVLIVTLILLLCLLFSMPAAATEAESVDADQCQQLAEQYLRDCAYVMYMYEDRDLTENTIAELTQTSRTSLTLQPAQIFTADSKTESNIVEADIIQPDFPDYIAEKAAYWKHVRQAQDVERTDFALAYDVCNTQIASNWAKITMGESMTFQYTDFDYPSAAYTYYNVYLYKSGGVWYVYDVESENWFDGAYRTETFDSKAAIEDFDNAYYDTNNNVNQTPIEEDNNVPGTRNNLTSYRPYIGTNAALYATTYTTSRGNVYAPDYYNDKFPSYSADCMNFASQCIWAGFSGSNVKEEAIRYSYIPMDDGGTYKWYSTDSASNRSYSWTSCHEFRDYIDDTRRTTGETEMEASVYPIPGNVNSFSPYISNYNTKLVGSVILVAGLNNDNEYVEDGHAIVVSHVYGDSRDQVYYCAHTAMAKMLKIGDHWPTGGATSIHSKLKVFVPTGHFYVKSCPNSYEHLYSSASDATCNNCGFNRLYVTNYWYIPKPVNSTITLTASTNINVYRMAVKVTKPNGSVNWLNEAMNTNTISNSYTVTQTGLYEITTYARDLNSSTPGSVQKSSTFNIVVY